MVMQNDGKPEEKNDAGGAFGQPLRRPEGVSLTEDERRAFKELYGSVTKGIRTVIGRKRFESIVHQARVRRAARNN